MKSPAPNGPTTPSSLYRAEFWRLALFSVRVLPPSTCGWLSKIFLSAYLSVARRRREVVIQNLLAAVNGNLPKAQRTAKDLFRQFALKLLDLWRYEAGLPIDHLFGQTSGWEHLEQAWAQKRGVLLLTPHLGNWEFGGPMLRRQGVTLQVITLTEPDEEFTRLRQTSRARWDIDTLVIGNDPLAFVEILRRLERGATVALLLDRPPQATAVQVELFGRPFDASVAAAELGRASDCLLLPVYLPRRHNKYEAHVLPPIPYERVALRTIEARRELTQRIMDVFQPIIGANLDQWYHFVPIWPREKRAAKIKSIVPFEKPL
jgi:KDO2-lipid IV(A) lauroyltransferase